MEALPEKTNTSSSKKPTIQASAALPWFAQAMLRHRDARLGEAKALYRQALRVDPAHADSLHMLGVLHAQRGDAAQAADLIVQALGHMPHDAAAWRRNLAGWTSGSEAPSITDD